MLSENFAYPGLMKYFERISEIPRGSYNEAAIASYIENFAKERGVKIVEMKAGDRVCSEKMEITCLAPAIEGDISANADINENSLVLQVEWKAKEESQKFVALFAGDISMEMEEVLCESEMLKDVDLVKANHHGSTYSNGKLWFDTLCPEYIIVSCSAVNRYGHPGKEAVERMEASGAQIFYTKEGGQITFPLIQ